MKISPISQPLERPSLEEIKSEMEIKKTDVTIAMGGFIVEDLSFHEFWGKKRLQKNEN